MYPEDVIYMNHCGDIIYEVLYHGRGLAQMFRPENDPNLIGMHRFGYRHGFRVVGGNYDF